jgi:hypothetical protein
MISPTNAFSPYIDGGGLSLGVTGGVALIGSTPTVIGGQSVTLTANTTNYVYLDLTAGTVSVNTTGFSTGVYSIATVVTLQNNIKTLTDSRADVTAAGPSSGPSLATVTLTAAQIAALSTTAITLVASPGTGKYIFPVTALYQVSAGAAGPSGNLFITNSTDGASAGVGESWLNDVEALTGPGLVYNPLQQDNGPHLANVENAALVIASDHSAGTGTLTIKVFVWYFVVTA